MREAPPPDAPSRAELRALSVQHNDAHDLLRGSCWIVLPVVRLFSWKIANPVGRHALIALAVLLLLVWLGVVAHTMHERAKVLYPEHLGLLTLLGLFPVVNLILAYVLHRVSVGRFERRRISIWMWFAL